MEYDRYSYIRVTDFEFEIRDEAIEFMTDRYGDDCMDNVRVANAYSDAEVDAYWTAWAKGCCGYCDLAVKIAGQPYYIGCNYGH